MFSMYNNNIYFYKIEQYSNAYYKTLIKPYFHLFTDRDKIKKIFLVRTKKWL